MSSAALKTVATATSTAASATGAPAKPKDLAELMQSPAVMAQIKMALPAHVTPERMTRIATTEMRRVPKLAEASPMSFLGAVMQCAQLGLEPGGALGHVYLLPFDKNFKTPDGKWAKRTEVQVILGYRGMIDLARRSGQIISLEARAVYEGDTFHCALGLDSKLEHEPDWQNANRTVADKLRFVYAVAKLKGGGVQFDVMSSAEINAIRDRSQGYQQAKAKADRGERADNPWMSDYSPMALKTVVRRLFKFLPVSIEMQRAVGLDEQHEAGQWQQNASLVDVSATLVDDDPAAATPDADGVLTPPPPAAPGPAAKAKAAPPADPPAAPLPSPSRLAGFIALVDAARDSEAAAAALDEARDALSPADLQALAARFDERFPD